MPVYYNLLIDSDGNILVFPYEEKNSKYTFQVYSPEGKYICDSAIDPGEYEVNINTALTFFQGSIFAVVTSRNDPDAYSRIMKINLF